MTVMCKGNDDDIVKILWTGGWDSTFRIVELSKQDVIVQPIYLYGDGRRSEMMEREAMATILEMINESAETNAQIMPIQFVRIGDIDPDNEVSSAYKRIHAITKLGSQHEWIALYAKANPQLEIGTEASAPENHRMIDSINRFCKLRPTGDVSNFEVDPEKSTADGIMVFGNLRFPIIDKTELDMLRLIREWKYEDVMSKIWFCHNPIHGSACGLCHPCQLKIESGLGFFLQPQALKRYNTEKLFKKARLGKVYSAYSRIMRRTIWS